MNEQDYHFLIQLYETKNITKVAQQQFLTQPAMTKRIRRIEDELNCQLLLRSKRGVEFTAIGETVVRYCRQIEQVNEQMKNEINFSKGIVGGTLNFGSSINYGRYRLPAVLRQYKQLYPHVDIHVTTSASSNLYRLLMENKISLAITRGNYAWSEGSILLSAEPVCLVQSYENQDKPLSESPYIGHRTDSYEEKRIEQWMVENNATQDIRIWVDDITTCREMAQAGIGWTIIPSICLEGFHGKVTPLYTKDGEMMLRNTYVLYRYSCYELQQVKLFLQLLAENDAAHPMLPATT